MNRRNMRKMKAKLVLIHWFDGPLGLSQRGGKTGPAIPYRLCSYLVGWFLSVWERLQFSSYSFFKIGEKTIFIPGHWLISPCDRLLRHCRCGGLTIHLSCSGTPLRK